MTTIQFTNEKGNVSAKARKHIKDSVVARITKAFETAGLDAVINADGGLSIAVAQDAADGAVIFSHLEFSISKRDPATKTAKSKRKAKADAAEAEMPDLFAEIETASTDVEGV